MSKYGVLFAAVLILAFAAPVFAAPDADELPMNSWEYEAFVELNDAGVLAGQPEGFGKQPITRVEAAEMLAKTLMPGDILTKVNEGQASDLEKLVEEFKSELLGMSIIVIALDNVTIVQP